VARTIPDFHYVAALSFSILIPVSALILLGLSSVPTVENRELLVMGVLYILVALSLILIYLLKRGFLSWK
jgi:NADH:ubiquinone oxidoreductase subunit 3 (subunit A)